MIGGLAILTKGFAGKALVALALVFVWNIIGRRLQKRTRPTNPNTKAERAAFLLGGFLQTTALTVILTTIALVLISGIVENPTNFRYAGF